MAEIGALTPKFLRCHAVTAFWEGGWSDHAADPGGKTMFGVTEKTWNAFRKKWNLAPKPVRQITRADAENLFYSEFWKVVGADNLADGVDLATYDAAVNSGPGRARKWLLASVGGADAETVKRICAKRLTFYQALKHWKEFGRGWSNRIADVQAKGVAWALAATGDRRVIADQVRQEADAKSATAAKQNAGAGASGAAGAGTVVTDQSTQAADWLLTGMAVLLFAAVVFLMWRAFLNRQQAEAFEAQAELMP